MKTRWIGPGLGLLLTLAVGCGKDDVLPAPPDAAAKEAGASDVVKGDVVISVDLAPSADTSAADSVPLSPDGTSVDAAVKTDAAGDTTPMVADANAADSPNTVRVDSGTIPRDSGVSDLLVDSQADARPESVARDAPVADASVVDEGTGG